MTREFPSVGDRVTQDTINVYADLSGDYNPLHVDLEVAAASEFGGTIAHGPIAFQSLFRSLTAGLGSPALPAGTKVAVTYRAPVRPGDTVSSQIEPAGDGDGEQYSAAAVNQDGVTVISGTVALPAS
jgi:3-hydroxybutyryl-CoA dehydratase